MRVKFFELVQKKAFDYVILFFILISTVLMALESPMDDHETRNYYILGILDHVMTFVFLLEMMIKIVAYGFLFNGKNSYLRDGWSQIDFIIVLASIASMLFSNYSQFSILKVIRMVRILKPLRMISRIRGL